MTKITYLGDEPVTWCGVRFEPNKPIEVTHPHILAKAPGNRFFDVAASRKAKAEEAVPEGDGGEDAVTAKGAAAKAAGKPRKVPPAYRGKDAEARWLAGYDADAAETEA